MTVLQNCVLALSVESVVNVECGVMLFLKIYILLQPHIGIEGCPLC